MTTVDLVIEAQNLTRTFKDPVAVDPLDLSVQRARFFCAGVVSHIASQAEFTPKNVQTQEERVHDVRF